MTRSKAVLEEVGDTVRNDFCLARISTGEEWRVRLVTANRLGLVGCDVHGGVSIVSSYVSLGRRDANKCLEFIRLHDTRFYAQQRTVISGFLSATRDEMFRIDT